MQMSETLGQAVRRINEAFYGRGWTDGLLIVPPTPDGVREMLVATGRGGGGFDIGLPYAASHGIICAPSMHTPTLTWSVAMGTNRVAGTSPSRIPLTPCSGPWTTRTHVPSH